MAGIAKSVCVFCGSRFGSDPDYKRAAADVGALLARENWRLVYGAGDVGMMGEVSQTTEAAGGETLGVIPTHLFERELGRRPASGFVITENMHERKKVMYMNSDAIVVLPGGAGSLDEFFEVLTWAQLGLHSKPIILLNTNGYWAPLKALVDHVIAHEFADPSLGELYEIADDVAGLEAKLREHLS
ncbi:LOG family protein [Litoreibacter roseus]|uniref:Cytokinin riboside 5'-monophosphate phosphoribohydrolase n=1 Tax=Litoreibacter roseus TaxID=2601869 RepID=A0A6N6JF55_9RHOB|nr:TIGR00730 family Rossman fold protein [Litoreibacter roseus]GFE63928.1 cytokinin riboside 5'-monophosphate phosphoribohydrolase [Litoreibacter roseus]